MRLYVAGAWADRLAVEKLAMDVCRGEHTLTFAWWACPPADTTDDRDRYLRWCAVQDLAGVEQADAVVFVYHPDTRGAWWEAGHAYRAGKPIVVVAFNAGRTLEDSPFMRLPGVRWITAPEEYQAEAVRDALREIAAAAADTDALRALGRGTRE